MGADAPRLELSVRLGKQPAGIVKIAQRADYGAGDLLGMQALATVFSIASEGSWSLPVCLLVGLVTVLVRQIWTVRMGMRGLVFTDMLQGLVAYVIAAIVCVLLLTQPTSPANWSYLSELPEKLLFLPGDGGTYGPLYMFSCVFTGVVGALCWPMSFVRIDGEQSHTGSTPMGSRSDAFLGLALLTVAVHGIASEFPVELRTSVTKVQLFPHSPNIVTSEALAHVELRADELEDARNAKIALDERIAGIEEDASVKITITNIEQRSPMCFPENGIRAIEEAAARSGRSAIRLKTVCGHDAVALAGSCPTALLFIPSEGCKAHSPDEYTSPDDLAEGVATLLELAVTVLEKGAF